MAQRSDRTRTSTTTRWKAETLNVSKMHELKSETTNKNIFVRLNAPTSAQSMSEHEKLMQNPITALFRERFAPAISRDEL